MSVEHSGVDGEVATSQAQGWIAACEVAKAAHYETARQHMALMSIAAISEPPSRQDIVRAGIKTLVSHPIHAAAAWNEIGRAQYDASVQEALTYSFLPSVPLSRARAD